MLAVVGARRATERVERRHRRYAIFSRCRTTLRGNVTVTYLASSIFRMGLSKHEKSNGRLSVGPLERANSMIMTRDLGNVGPTEAETIIEDIDEKPLLYTHQIVAQWYDSKHQAGSSYIQSSSWQKNFPCSLQLVRIIPQLQQRSPPWSMLCHDQAMEWITAAATMLQLHWPLGTSTGARKYENCNSDLPGIDEYRKKILSNALLLSSPSDTPHPVEGQSLPCSYLLIERSSNTCVG